MKNLHKLISLLFVIALTVACSSNKDDDPTITIATSEFTVGAEQDSEAKATFSINVEWTTSTISYNGETKDWLTVTPTRGGAGANQTITIKAAANPATVERTASFTINYGGTPQKLTITQLAKSIDPTITITTSEFTVGAEQDSEAVATFSINVDWTTSTISYDGDIKDWLTLTPTSGGAGANQTITMKAAANLATVERTASFTINYGEEKEHKLTITQLGIVPAITIANSEYTVDGEADSEVIASFSVNVDWTTSVISYVGDAKDWLTVTPASGKAGADQTITMKAAVNPAVERTASFTINYGEEKEHKLTIRQLVKKEIDITADFDATFAAKLQEKGYILDATKILLSEVINITKINVSGTLAKRGELTSLSGIEHFEALTELDCSYNKFVTLDVSKNLALTRLDCFRNYLTSLDVSKNIALKELLCYRNQLISLDVSLALTYLDCTNNKLTVLNLSNNTDLMEVRCFTNQITALDVSKSTALTYLDCNFNDLLTLNVKENIALVELYCSSNQLTILDVSKHPALTKLVCFMNQIAILDVGMSTALTSLRCFSNQLTALDVSKNTVLTLLDCYRNQIASLNVSNNPALTELYCYENQITALDVSKSTALIKLDCYENQLSDLDISKNTALTRFFCYDNPGIGITFIVKTWFDNNNIPVDFPVEGESWTFGDKIITIDYQKVI